MTRQTRLEIGDWVTSYSRGIWRIYRILGIDGGEIPALEHQGGVTIFSKRFLNSEFKRSFSQECCNSVFVKKLDAESKTRLDRFIEHNKKLYQAFVDYRPKPINHVYNARIGIPANGNSEQLESLISKEMEFRKVEVDPYIKSLGLDPESQISWTAQFVSYDHTIRDGALVFRFSRILEF